MSANGESIDNNHQDKTKSESEKVNQIKCPDCDMEELLCDKCSAINGDSKKSQVPRNPDPSGLFGEMLDKVTGPYLVALKDIPAGTILWKEDPLVAAPSNPEMFAENGFSVCAGCCALAPKSALVKCSKCGWLVCGKECAEMPDHKFNECSRKTPSSYAMSGGSPFAILGLRAVLLKDRDVAKWNELMDLKDVVAHQLDPMVDYLTKFQLDAELRHLRIQDKISVPEYEKIFHIIKLNSLGLSAYYEDSQGEKRFAWGLYKKASLLTYSCLPNCGLLIDVPPTHELRVHATTLIKKGERLTRFCRERIAGLKYLGGVVERQWALQQDGFKYIRCKCGLCSDSTEKGTNLSTLICNGCKKSSVLPLNPGAQAGLGDFDQWEWKCTTVGCGSSSVKNSDLQKLNEIILNIPKAIPMTETSFKACSNRWPQLKSSFKNRVHSNYWAIFAAASELCRQYCHCYAPPLESPDWRHHEEIMLFLLNIFDVIRPGMSAERAWLQRSLMRVWFFELWGKSLKPLNSSRDPAEFSRVLAKLDEAIEMGKESIKYYKLNPESQILKEMRKLREK